MTFGELRTILRNDMLAESSTDYFSDSELLDFLTRSAKEIAGALELFRGVDSITVASGATSAIVSADYVTMNQVLIGGYRLEAGDAGDVIEARSLAATSWPRYYMEDRRSDSNTTLLFGPAAPETATLTYQFVDNYDVSAATTATAVWSGQWDEFHELVALRAAVKAYRASLEHDLAQAYEQAYQMQLAEFASVLGGKDLATRQMEASSQ